MKKPLGRKAVIKAVAAGIPHTRNSNGSKAAE